MEPQIEASWKEKQLKEMPSTESKIIPRLISYCISSGKADPMVFNQGKRGKFTNRSQLHVMLLQPFGTGKSTALKDLPGIHPLTNFTLPGFVGSINKQGQLIDSALLQAAGKTLFVDEFHNLGEKARQAMLSLLEDQRYSRALGFGDLNVKIGKKYFKCYIKKNYINIKHCRFSCLATGLYMTRKKFNDMALASRFIILNIKTERDHIFRMLRGESLYDIKKYDFKGGIVFDNYLTYLEDFRSVIDSLPFNAESVDKYASRIANDLARMICFSNERFGNFTIDKRRDYDGLIGLTPLLFYNHLCSGLTLTEYQILDSLIFDTENHTKIANSLDISRRFVVECHNKFRGMGLIK